MKRYKLIDARNARGMSQNKLADAIGADEVSISRWENGTQTPQSHFIGKLCAFFGVRPVELNLDAAFNDCVSAQGREDEVIEMLKDYDRRELLAVLAKLPALAGVDLTVLFSTTVVAPEHHISVCEATIKACWSLLGRNGRDLVDGLLLACLPELENLASHLSPHQHQAASLVVEAKIIQMIIAGHQTKFARREMLGSEAVRFGAMSGDSNRHAAALAWHGDTYKNETNQNCQPELAIANLTNALKCGTISSLNKAAISMDLAKAYALVGNEKLARDFAEQAQIAMPENPELDPLYQCIRVGQSELDLTEGNTYLALAKRFPAKTEYGQLAYDALVKSTSRQSLSPFHLSQALIQKAEAARGIGEMRYYLDCLEEGVHIALQTGHNGHIVKAITILQKAPMKWRNETQYKELRKLLTPRIATQ